MQLGEKNMKCLKIVNGKGEFSLDGDSWKVLDDISKAVSYTHLTLPTNREV